MKNFIYSLFKRKPYTIEQEDKQLIMFLKESEGFFYEENEFILDRYQKFGFQKALNISDYWWAEPTQRNKIETHFSSLNDFSISDCNIDMLDEPEVMKAYHSLERLPLKTKVGIIIITHFLLYADGSPSKEDVRTVDLVLHLMKLNKQYYITTIDAFKKKNKYKALQKIFDAKIIQTR